MRRRRIVLHLAMVWLCFHACTSIDVRTDFDPSVDFTRFKTFAFGGLTDINKAGILDNSLTRKRIESIVARELTAKGLRQAELDQNPDLSVHYWIGVKEKQKVENIGPSGYYGGTHPRHGGGVGYGNVTTYEYKEGTLIVDLVEPARKELVWRATMVANLEDTTGENIELGNKAIARAFKDYPPTGSAPAHAEQGLPARER